LGQRLSIPVEFGNDIPETLLEGWWEVAPHPIDLAHNSDLHPWIAVSPPTFCTNQGQATVMVDTLELMANCTYQRQLVLHSNSSQDVYTIPITIRTAPLPLGRRRLPTARLLIIWLMAAITPLLLVTLTFTLFVTVALFFLIGIAYIWTIIHDH
jgi:hypothetical protein